MDLGGCLEDGDKEAKGHADQDRRRREDHDEEDCLVGELRDFIFVHG